MGVRTRRAHKHSRTHIVGFSIAAIFGFLILGALALFFSLDGLVRMWLEDLPDYTSADAYLVAEPTHIYDANGDVIAEFYMENRRSVSIDEVSPYVIQAIVDIEDERFYQHNGVDPTGILRAVYVQLLGGGQGASTITQQLVRNTVLRDEQFDQTIARKVREAYIAIQMEKTYSKDQILMMYLNTIFFGNNSYGIETASLGYFGKHARDLTLAEAALLAGLPQSPSNYNPLVNLDLAVQRRNLVLGNMLKAGDITQEEYEAAKAEEVVLNPVDTTMDHSEKFPYFVDYVRGLLEQDFDQDTIFKGGLKVYTTIDPTWQAMAEEACQEGLEDMYDDELEAAMVAIDPATGYIKAMVGGKDYSVQQYNLATQARRQPGSSFKVFTLSAAIGQGMNPNVYLNCNSPLQVTPTWRVINYGGQSYGVITLARATEISSNTGYAQVSQKIGPEAIVETAKAMGIDEDLPAYASITLGSVGIPPVQMAEAYATLATGGIHRDGVAITRIVDRSGNVTYEHGDTPTQALEPEVAAAVTEVLEGVVSSSMGTANVIPSLSTFNQPVAGKTGTTEETRDLWFCGYTPQVAVAIWNGYPNEEKTIYHFGTYAHPSDVSCPIFAYFCNKLLAHTQREEFPKASQPEYRNNAEWEFPNTYTTGTTGRSTNTGNNSNNNANNNSYNNNYNNNSNNEYGNNSNNEYGND